MHTVSRSQTLDKLFVGLGCGFGDRHRLSGETAKFDKSVLKRMTDIEKLDPDTRDKLYFLIDNVVQNFKAKKAYAG